MSQRQDPIIPAIQAWLQEPIWLPESDLVRIAHVVHRTPQQRRWRAVPTLFPRRSTSMFGTIRVAIAGGIVAATVGLALPAVLSPQDASLVGASASPAPSTVAATSIPVIELDPAFTLGASSGQSAGAWQELARLSSVREDGGLWNEMRRLHALGDRLVAIGSEDETTEGPTHDLLLTSTDGIAWERVVLPATDPRIEDLAATATGLMAVGSDATDDGRAARVWLSGDGVTWTDAPAPDTTSISRIYTATDPVTVRVGKYLWIQRDGGEWERMTQFGDQELLKGPGGYIAWQTRSEVDPSARLLFSADLRGWQEMGLPDQLDVEPGVGAGIQLFALPDAWVMVPDHTLPDSILVSTDGFTWVEQPRPIGMMEGDIRWMSQVGDQVQAFGMVDGTGTGGLWTWTLGDPAVEPAMLAGTDEFIDRPVAFGDGHLATGLQMGQGWHLTMWQLPAA